MLFPTTVFLIFFAFVFAGGWLLINRRRLWAIYMLAASYVFYGWWNWRLLFLIIFCTILNHAAACLLMRMHGRRSRLLLLLLTIGCDLGVLGFFKYYRFFVLSAYAVCSRLGIACELPLLEIILPVGISFFTFQAMSYVIDVYRNDIEPAESVLEFATYLAFFPQLVAGPIVRASIFLPQIKIPIDVQRIDVGRAATLILVGLFKKIVLANILAQALADPLFDYPDGAAALDVLLGVYGYACQIYCDFSAYSDIAIGVALLLGIRFPANFNAPYFALSFREFWQRWHISLSTWLRDYLYIPMGGGRVKTWKIVRNLMITFLLGGLWHGAQWRFVAWGALHGSFLIGERLFARIPFRVATHGYVRWVVTALKGLVVFHGVCLSWVFFRAETFEDAWVLLGQLGRWRKPELLTLTALIVLPVAFAIQALDGDRLAPFWRWFNRRSFLLQGLLAALILTVILGLGPHGVSPFIYFQF